MDVPDFPEGIRRALRMDPDIILVGEMRDLETIHAAIEAAETGHVVFGTLHTSGASSTINRIIDVFPKEQQDQIRTQLSTALIGVLSQALLPKKPEGLVAAYEMMVVTPAIAEPDPREQDLPHRLQHPDRPQARHVPAGREPVPAVEGRPGATRKRCCCGSSKPAELAAKIAQAEKGVFDEEDEDEDEDEDEERTRTKTRTRTTTPG